MSRKRPGRGRLRLLASLLLAALLLCSPALADGAADALDAAVGALFEEYDLSERNFALGFRALGRNGILVQRRQAL